jgi:hypothetical protein
MHSLIFKILIASLEEIGHTRWTQPAIELDYSHLLNRPFKKQGVSTAEPYLYGMPLSIWMGLQ